MRRSQNRRSLNSWFSGRRRIVAAVATLVAFGGIVTVTQVSDASTKRSQQRALAACNNVKAPTAGTSKWSTETKRGTYTTNKGTVTHHADDGAQDVPTAAQMRSRCRAWVMQNAGQNGGGQNGGGQNGGGNAGGQPASPAAPTESAAAPAESAPAGGQNGGGQNGGGQNGGGQNGGGDNAGGQNGGQNGGGQNGGGQNGGDNAGGGQTGGQTGGGQNGGGQNGGGQNGGGGANNGGAAPGAGLGVLANSCAGTQLAPHDGFQVGNRCVSTQFGEVGVAANNPSLLITEAPENVQTDTAFTIQVSTRNLIRDRFLAAGQGGYYVESSLLQGGLVRGHFHTACRMLGSTNEAPDPAPAPAFFVATEDGKGAAAPDTVAIQVPGLPDAGLAQCAVWAGDGSHRIPMMERANQTPAFDAVRINVGGGGNDGDNGDQNQGGDNNGGQNGGQNNGGGNDQNGN